MTHSFRQGCTLALACLLLYAYGLSWSAAHTPQSVPNPRPLWAGHVANPDQVIDAEHAEQIERLLSRLEADRGVQVAVVALADVESPVDVIDFAQQLFEHWGIGDRSRDDGLLVLLVRDQRTVRMHTGYGLEGLLPDLLCHRIEQQLMKPAFKEGRYGEGLLSGLTEVDRIVRDPEAAAQAVAALPAETDGWRVMRWVVSAPIAFIGLLFFAVRNMQGYFSREARDSNPGGSDRGRRRPAAGRPRNRASPSSRRRSAGIVPARERRAEGDRASSTVEQRNSHGIHVVVLSGRRSRSPRTVG